MQQSQQILIVSFTKILIVLFIKKDIKVTKCNTIPNVFKF